MTSLMTSCSHIITAEKVKKNGSDCEEWRWGPCVPNSKDCGVGYREGTCNEETKRLKCKIPCNWKKEFGGEWASPSQGKELGLRSGALSCESYHELVGQITKW